MMPIFLIALIFLFSGCDTNLNKSGNYFPGEYLPYLHVGIQTTIVLSNNRVTSGETISAIITAKDENGNNISRGGSDISLSSSGPGSVQIVSLVDNSNGTYSAEIKGITVGQVSLKVNSNKKTVSTSESLMVNVGPFNPTVSDFFVSRTNYLVNDVANIIFTPKDTNGNLVDDSTLSIYATLTEGTSTGSVSSITYSQGKYVGTLTATGEGTKSQLNFSIRGYGIATSKIPILVAATKPDYTKSTLSLSYKSLRVGQSTSVLIYVKDSSGNIINVDNLPITLEAYDGTSLISVTSINKSGTYYVANISGTQAGTVSKIRARVDGEYIVTTGEITGFQVIP